jgi:hypothetical protein
MRKDAGRIRIIVGRAEQFLRSYPVACDQRVRDWCMERKEEVRYLVPASMPAVLDTLINDPLP